MIQVLKQQGLMLVFCLFTIWVQMAWLSVYFGNRPVRDSLFVLTVLLAGGLIFCLFIRFFSQNFVKTAQAAPDWLMMLVQSQAQRLSIPVPQIHILNTAGLNAFAMDDLTRHGHVLFHQQVLSALTQEEVEAVLAHEMCHVSNGHAGILSFMQGVMLAITLPLALMFSVVYCFVNGFSEFKTNLLTTNSFLSLICFPFTSVVLLLFSRQWEYQADTGASQLVGKERYLQALRCLHGSLFQHPNLLGAMNSASKNTQAGGLTHPSLARRINALQEIGS